MEQNELEPLYDKKYQCIICEFNFTSKKVRTKFLKVLKTDTDFCSDYEDESINPGLYHVIVCPCCGYAFTDESETYFRPGTKELVEEKANLFLSQGIFCGERTLKDAIKTFKGAIAFAALKNEKPIVIAGLYMRLTWLYRKLGNEAEEMKYMEYTAKAYEKSYSDYDPSSNMSSIRIAYLIGELYRRLGNYTLAATYFSKVMELKRTSNEHKIIEMARDQWHLMRDQNKENKEETVSE